MQTVTQILVDFSGSMKGKLEFAKRLLLEEVIPTLDYSAKIGVKTFRSENKLLKITETLPLSIVDKEQLTTAISGINSPDGGTPIAAAIRDSLTALKRYPAFDKRIILVTDGEENEGGDYEAEARSAGEQGIHCQIHIIGIGLNAPQEKKAISISSLTKGSTCNIPYSKDAVYDQPKVQTSLTGFKNALKRETNPTYTGASLSSNRLQQPSTPSYNSSPSSGVAPQHPTSPIKSPITVSPSKPPSDLTTVSQEENKTADKKEETLSVKYSIEKESNPVSVFESGLLSSVLNSVLQRMEDLSNEVKELKLELKNSREEKSSSQEQIKYRKTAANELVSSLLTKRYGDRVESLQEAQSDQIFKVLFEENGPVEYYVLSKISIDGAFYLNKEEWRLFLNNTKNTQVYLQLPDGSQPQYVLIDNLLDWLLRGKVVPYLTKDINVEAGNVYFSFT